MLTSVTYTCCYQLYAPLWKLNKWVSFLSYIRKKKYKSPNFSEKFSLKFHFWSADIYSWKFYIFYFPKKKLSRLCANIFRYIDPQRFFEATGYIPCLHFLLWRHFNNWSGFSATLFRFFIFHIDQCGVYVLSLVIRPYMLNQ